VRRYAPLIIPAILVSLRNTDQLAMALEARGFGRAAPRTTYLEHPWTARDTLFLAGAIVVLAVSFWLRLSASAVL
jgi:energy-coupling factor transport system permease protein